MNSSPPLAEWGEIARRNGELLRQFATSVPGYDRHALQTEVIAEAESFMAELRKIYPELPGYQSNQSADFIVASGHQPIIYHAGLAAKNGAMARLLHGTAGVGLNLIIDLDEGAGGEFSFPSIREGKVRLENGNLVQGGSSFQNQVVSPRSVVEALTNDVVRYLTELGERGAAENSRRAFGIYASLGGTSIVAANTIVRRMMEESPGYLELPLSRLIRLSSLQKIIGWFLTNFERLTTDYNSNLDSYRKEHKIDNAANPFPNLKISDETYEVPFWSVNVAEGTRMPLRMRRKDGNAELLHGDRSIGLLSECGSGEKRCDVQKDYLIAPRAMMTTLLMRVFVCDLFIHGQGGARYDRATDRYLQNYLNISPPAFVNVSADKYLFQDKRELISEYESIDAERRQICFHLEKYIENPLFPDAVRPLGLSLGKRRTELVAKLAEVKKSGESAAELTHEIKAVDGEIKSFVDSQIAERFGVILSDPQSIPAYRSREYPFFMV